MKVVINKCWGGFSLSKAAYEFLGLEWDGYGYKYTPHPLRTDTRLVECVERLGDAASGKDAKLKVVEIPDDVKFEIVDGDDGVNGVEIIEEKHRKWS